MALYLPQRVHDLIHKCPVSVTWAELKGIQCCFAHTYTHPHTHAHTHININNLAGESKSKLVETSLKKNLETFMKSKGQNNDAEQEFNRRNQLKIFSKSHLLVNP